VTLDEAAKQPAWSIGTEEHRHNLTAANARYDEPTDLRRVVVNKVQMTELSEELKGQYLARAADLRGGGDRS
jgi:hypothetical protein